jgi:mRNA interferase RelE/StbE
MNVEFTKLFLKQLDKIRDPIIKNRVKSAILKAESANALTELNNIKKLSGAENHYRIRIGDYRIGFFVEEDTITFARVLHRRKFCRYFP